MKFSYYVNNKLVSREIPKKNRKKPKTKRLRKKKLWLHCGDCGRWFKRYVKSHGRREDGKHICNDCLMTRIKKARPDLFDRN